MFMKIISELYQKIKTKVQKCSNQSELVEADYYNGSSNDIENIFIELRKLVNPRICPCKTGFVRDRINFLIFEGLQILNFYDNMPSSAKVDEEELEKFFSKKIKTKKTTTKKSNGRKRG
jgi:hypothetical protein